MASVRSKYLNSKQSFLQEKSFTKKYLIVSLVKLFFLKKGLFLSLGFCYLVKPLQGLRGRGAEPHMFSISNLEFRIYKPTLKTYGEKK